MATDTTTQPQISTAKKAKPLTMIFLLFVCGGLTVGFLIGFMARGLFATPGGNNGQPTPTPTSISPTTTGSVSPTPTVSGEPEENAYDGWTQYVLSDCQIKLFGPKDFTPGLRGEQGTCGSFTAASNQTISNFDTYPGMFMLFLPFLKPAQSLFGYDEQNAAAYIKGLSTDPTKNNNTDLLLGSEDITLAGQETKVYHIKRKGNLGTAFFIFYKELGKDFVIVYGGKALDQFMPEVDLLLKSVVSLEEKAS